MIKKYDYFLLEVKDFEEVWEEEEPEDFFAYSVDDDVITLRYDNLIKYTSKYGIDIKTNNIDLDDNIIRFGYMGEYGEYIDIGELLKFRQYIIDNSRYVKDVKFTWNGEIIIVMDDKYIYEF